MEKQPKKVFTPRFKKGDRFTVANGEMGVVNSLLNDRHERETAWPEGRFHYSISLDGEDEYMSESDMLCLQELNVPQVSDRSIFHSDAQWPSEWENPEISFSGGPNNDNNNNNDGGHGLDPYLLKTPKKDNEDWSPPSQKMAHGASKKRNVGEREEELEPCQLRFGGGDFT